VSIPASSRKGIAAASDHLGSTAVIAKLDLDCRPAVAVSGSGLPVEAC